MIRKLLRSKYIRIALIVVVVAMIASGVIERPLPTKDHSPAKPPFTEAEWKEVEAKGVKTVVPFGEYKELWLVDGYRHLAAGKTWEGKIELMNFEDGRTVVVDGAEEYFEGRLAELLKEPENTEFLKTKTMLIW